MLLLTDSSVRSYTSDLQQVTHGVRSPYQSWDVHCTQLIFVEPGVKVNGTCYRDELHAIQ